jgi:hypothetical protein
LPHCVWPASLWMGYKRVLFAVALMTFAPHTVSRLHGSVKVMPPLPTWPSISGSPNKLQASLSNTSSNTDTSCVDLMSVTPGRGCSYSPNGDTPARRRRRLPLRRQSTGGDLSWDHQGSLSSKRRSQRSPPPDDCGHPGDLVSQADPATGDRVEATWRVAWQRCPHSEGNEVAIPAALTTSYPVPLGLAMMPIMGGLWVVPPSDP